MALYEDSVAKLRNGDCEKKFWTGRCNNNTCPWTHTNVLPADMRNKGKGKGKGKGKAKGKVKGTGTYDNEGKGKSKGKGKGKEKGKKGKGKGKGKETRTCNNCHKAGHIAADCWFQSTWNQIGVAAVY